MARYWQLLVKAQGDSKGASKAMRDLKKSSRNLQRAIGVDFGRIARYSALALGAGLAASVKVGVDEMLEAQRVTAQTNAVIRSTGGAAGVSAKGLAKLAGALSDVSGVDDELIQSGANVLLTFTNVRNAAGKNNNVFNQATRVALDMSTALGTDLKSANIQLGKALNDPIKGISALSRVGVSFTDQQKDMIDEMMDAGNVMGAQKIILAELNKEFGGSAKAAGGTAQGAINRLKNSYAEMSATIVEAVIPSIAGMADRLNKLVQRVRRWAATRDGQEALKDLRNGLQRLTGALGTAAGAVGKVIAVMYKWRDVLIPVTAGVLAAVAALKAYRIAVAAGAAAQALLNVVLTANPIGVVVLALVALAAGLVVAYKRSETFRSIVQGAFDAVTSAARSLKDMFDAAKTKAVDAWNAIQVAWSAAGVFFDNLKTSLTRKFSGLWIGIKTSFDAVIDSVRNAWSSFGFPKPSFSGLFGNIKTAFKSAINAVIGMWNDLEFRIPAIKVLGKQVFGGTSIGTPNIPYLARGGVIRSPGAAIVGEAGPEMVQLPRGARVTPLGAGAAAQSVYHIHVRDEIDLDALIQRLQARSRRVAV